MFKPDDHSDLDQLLGTSIAAFDIPDAVYARAVARYQVLADWLATYWGDGGAGGAVYPQGSIRLGVMVAPIHPKDEYDIDLVNRRDLAKASMSQRELKDDVGDGLESYLGTAPEGDPRLAEGKRCWTLDYPGEPFHMDVLPAIPNAEARPNGILLTDRALREWQRSNPIDYAEWFHAVMRAEAQSLREAVAKRMDVEQAPPSVLKTTLQRTVQALKRHRDIYFSRTGEEGPASIILTTLAAMAYPGGGSLYEVLGEVTTRMPELVERRSGVFWVPNPVQPEENFADRWRAHPDRADRFFCWMAAAQSEFSDFGRDRGVDRVIERLAETFGEEPARHAGSRFGAALAERRREGGLRVGATGLLGAASGRRVPDHTFHGDPPAKRT